MPQRGSDCQSRIGAIKYPIMTWGAREVRPNSFVQLASYAANSSFGPRRLADFEFVWLLSGRAQWTSNQISATGAPEGETIRLTPGTLLLARRGTIDYYEWAREERCSHAFVHFALSPDTATESVWPTFRTMPPDSILSGICSYLLGLAAIGSEEARARSDQLISLLVDVFIDGPFPSLDRGQFPARVGEVLEIVRAIWDRDGLCLLDVARLAQDSNLSVGHLSRLFRDSFGVGPASLLEYARLVSAAIALQRTNTPMGEIAALSGFSNPYHFSRRFSRLYKLPPGRWRREYKNGDPFDPIQDPSLRPVISFLLSPLLSMPEEITNIVSPATGSA